MKKGYRITAAFLAVVLMMNLTLSIEAKEENTPKEEVVYVNLNQDGSVNDIYVVNIFELEEKGQIIDYGDYESLRNMTTTAPVQYEDGQITIDAQAGKLYCEGKTRTAIIPWKIAINYYLNGVEYTADQIAGKSGDLKITLSIRENKDCSSSFFEHYALQVTLVLDTNRCRNVVAEDATIANVGSDKQLTFTLLPGKETDICVTAAVENFEMAGLQIAGVPLHMNIEVEDEELQSKIDEVIDAIHELDEGADELYEGADDLYEGTKELYDGVSELSGGAEELKEGAEELSDATNTLHTKVTELNDGVGSLQEGADSLSSGLTELDGKSEQLREGARAAFVGLCDAAETQLNSELTANGMDKITLTADNYASVLDDLEKKLGAGNARKTAYNTALKEVTKQVEARADQLYLGYVSSQADTIYDRYLQSQADAIYQQAAAQAVTAQLTSSGYTEEQALAYLQTPEGQAMIANTVSSMTEEQKAQILAQAKASLTQEQKDQILQGAAASLTEEQKEAIRNGYIQETMNSEAVQSQISAASKSASKAESQIAQLREKLDNFNTFYEGVVAYTDGVKKTAEGAQSLQSGVTTLKDGTNTLESSVGELNLAVLEFSNGSEELCSGVKEVLDGAGDLRGGAKELRDGAGEMKDAAGEFVSETSGMNDEVSEKIDSMITSITGGEAEIVSFVSEDNTNVKAVQFVIKTDAIEVEEIEQEVQEEEEKLSFWQKLRNLFKFHSSETK